MGIVRFHVSVLTCHEDKGWAKQNNCIISAEALIRGLMLIKHGRPRFA